MTHQRRAVGGVLLLFCAVVSSCVPYSDFKLPRQPGGSLPDWKLTFSGAAVIVRGNAGNFDAVDALNPSVIRRGSEYWNLYSGYDGKAWHTALATSVDGRQWVKKGKILSPDPASWEGDYIAANGSAVEFQNQILYFYQGGRVPQIGLARIGADSKAVRQGGPVLPAGPTGSWDERGVADPYAIVLDGKLYLYYLGQDRARRQRLGVAVSGDGVHWKKLRTNPILELGEAGDFDEIGLGEPAVWVSHGYYWMLYTGRDKVEHRRMGLAYSQDGVFWKRLQGKVFAGAEGWNRDVVCDPTVLLEGGKIRLWYGGGDKPLPAEGLNGQIGEAMLTP